MFYLFGVNHDKAQMYAVDGEKGDGHSQLENALTEQLNICRPAVVAEEMNCETLTQKEQKSVPLEFANDNSLEHLFCDPNKGWRRANCCPDAIDIQHTLEGRDESYIRNNLRRSAEAIDIAKCYPKRERYWFENLRRFHHLDVFFVCGYDHLESFKRLLADNCIPHSPEVRIIGVDKIAEDDHRSEVQQHLNEHPELRNFNIGEDE